jgi:hypothetical protein
VYLNRRNFQRDPIKIVQVDLEDRESGVHFLATTRHDTINGGNLKLIHFFVQCLIYAKSKP